VASDRVSTQNVWPYYNVSNVEAASKPKDNSLGKDDFLKILVTQLSNQDPMEPLKDNDFIAQMAQFTSVEQLMNMSKEMTLLRQNLGMASGLIGKTVEWTETDESGVEIPKSGKVDSIVVKDGVQYIKSGENQVPLDALTSIAESREAADE
jgi:flagellar basal-body rod modification protein FlgD